MTREAGRLEEQLGALGDVDAVVDRRLRGLRHPLVAAALVGDARGPDLLRVDGRERRPCTGVDRRRRVDPGAGLVERQGEQVGEAGARAAAVRPSAADDPGRPPWRRSRAGPRPRAVSGTHA